MAQKSIKINFIMNSLLSLSSLIFPLITFPYISRVLTPSGTGKLSFASSVVSYFSLFAQLGIPTYGIRACSKVRDDRRELSKTVHELFLINTLMSIFSYILLMLMILLIPRLRDDPRLFLVTGLVIIFNDLGMEWLYQALEKYSYIAVRSILFKIVAILLMFWLVKKPSDYIIYCAISVLASSGSKILNFIQLRKYIDIKSYEKYTFKKHIKPILVFFAMSCAVTIYTNLDVVMLGFLKTDTDVGYYNAAVKVKTILVSIVTSIGAVLLPRTSYYIEHGMRKDYIFIVKKAIRFVLLISVPLTVYFMLFARECIIFISGNLYENSILPMIVIMPTVVFIGISNIIGYQLLIPNGKENVVMKSELLGAGVDLVMNCLLIPIYASTGAAIGTLFAELVVLLYQFKEITLEERTCFLNDSFIKIIIGVLISTGSCILLKRYISSSEFIILLVSSILFFGVYFAFMIIAKEKFIMDILNDIKNKLLSGQDI